MKKLLLLAALVLGLFVSCGDSDDSGASTGKRKIARMDIRDASALFIKSGGSRASGGDTLFKITEDGVIKQVTYTDEYGREVTDEYTPLGICIVDDSPYFFVQFADGFYIVNKNTGAVYESPWVGSGEADVRPGVQNGEVKFHNEKTIKADKHGNIYYKKDYQVHKIDFSNPDNVVDKTLTPQSDDVIMYVVSDNGELLYRIYKDDSYFHRLRTTSGRLIPYRVEVDDIWDIGYDYLVFRGFDGNIHVFDRQAIKVIQFNSDDTYSEEKILEDRSIINSVVSLDGYPYLIKLSDRYIAMGVNGLAVVIDSKDRSIMTGIPQDVCGGIKISQLEYNDSYIYCCGQKNGAYSLLRINPYTYESEAVVRDNDYEIYSFVVLDDNTITFNGLRLSDGKTILATIDKNGRVKVLEEYSNYTQITLNRLQ